MVHRVPSETSADGERIVTDQMDLYQAVKRIAGDPDSASRDEIIVMAAFLVDQFEQDH